MKQKEVDNFFINNEKEIFLLSEKLYHTFFRRFDFLQPDDIPDEFYLYICARKYKHTVSVYDLCSSGFIRFLCLKYCVELKQENKIKKEIYKLNKKLKEGKISGGWNEAL